MDLTSFSLSVLTRKSFDDFIALTSSSVDMVLVSCGLKAGSIPVFWGFFFNFFFLSIVCRTPQPQEVCA